jgi:hypothetical protein
MDGPHRLWHASIATFDLPQDDEAVAAMRAVPPTDVCSACHKALETVSTGHAASFCVAVLCDVCGAWHGGVCSRVVLGLVLLTYLRRP